MNKKEFAEGLIFENDMTMLVAIKISNITSRKKLTKRTILDKLGNDMIVLSKENACKGYTVLDDEDHMTLLTSVDNFYNLANGVKKLKPRELRMAIESSEIEPVLYSEDEEKVCEIEKTFFNVLDNQPNLEGLTTQFEDIDDIENYYGRLTELSDSTISVLKLEEKAAEESNTAEEAEEHNLLEEEQESGDVISDEDRTDDSASEGMDTESASTGVDEDSDADWGSSDSSLPVDDDTRRLVSEEEEDYEEDTEDPFDNEYEAPEEYDDAEEIPTYSTEDLSRSILDIADRDLFGYNPQFKEIGESELLVDDEYDHKERISTIRTNTLNALHMVDERAYDDIANIRDKFSRKLVHELGKDIDKRYRNLDKATNVDDKNSKYHRSLEALKERAEIYRGENKDKIDYEIDNLEKEYEENRETYARKRYEEAKAEYDERNSGKIEEVREQLEVYYEEGVANYYAEQEMRIRNLADDEFVSGYNRLPSDIISDNRSSIINGMIGEYESEVNRVLENAVSQKNKLIKSYRDDVIDVAKAELGDENKIELEVTNKTSKLTSRIAELEREAQAKDSKIDSLTEKVKAMETEIEEAKKVNEQQSADNKKLSDALQGSSEDLSALKAELSNERIALEETKRSLETQMAEKNNLISQRKKQDYTKIGVIFVVALALIGFSGLTYKLATQPSQSNTTALETEISNLKDQVKEQKEENDSLEKAKAEAESKHSAEQESSEDKSAPEAKPVEGDKNSSERKIAVQVDGKMKEGTVKSENDNEIVVTVDGKDYTVQK